MAQNQTINPMPLTKLTSMVNYFLLTTTNHLNKISVHSQEKLNEYEKKIRRLDAMVTLLESKLNSLPPEITANYPPLIAQKLDDVNVVFTNVKTPNQNTDIPFINKKDDEVKKTPVPSVRTQKDEKRVTLNTIHEEFEEEKKENEEVTPEMKYKMFIEEHPELEKFAKMLKYGIPMMGVEQKAKFESIDEELIKVIYLEL